MKRTLCRQRRARETRLIYLGHKQALNDCQLRAQRKKNNDTFRILRSFLNFGSFAIKILSCSLVSVTLVLLFFCFKQCVARSSRVCLNSLCFFMLSLTPVVRKPKTCCFEKYARVKTAQSIACDCTATATHLKWHNQNLWHCLAHELSSDTEANQRQVERRTEIEQRDSRVRRIRHVDGSNCEHEGSGTKWAQFVLVAQGCGRRST